MDKNIKALIKIQKEKGYSPTFMAALLGVHTATYIRYIKEQSTPKSQAVKQNIEELLKRLS